jgi:hypothetical protein
VIVALTLSDSASAKVTLLKGVMVALSFTAPAVVKVPPSVGKSLLGVTTRVRVSLFVPPLVSVAVKVIVRFDTPGVSDVLR